MKREDLPEGAVVLTEEYFDEALLGYSADDKAIYEYDRLVDVEARELCLADGYDPEDLEDWQWEKYYEEAADYISYNLSFTSEVIVCYN